MGLLLNADCPNCGYTARIAAGYGGVSEVRCACAAKLPAQPVRVAVQVSKPDSDEYGVPRVGDATG